MHSGPRAETRPIQKIAILISFAALGAMVVISVLDHRFGWSSVPAAVSVLGDVLVTIGLGIAMLVIFQNNYAAATVAIQDGQQLVSTGLYGFVRHPMYTGNVIMMAGIPLALGSYWGLVFVSVGLLGLVVRIHDEEKLLLHSLPGYDQYTHQVHYRLLPYLW